MKLLKIDRLRGLSIGCLVTAVILLIFEISAPKFEGTFFIITMIVLTSALEEVRLEFRELKDEIQKQQSGR
jgi:hypothetical protein